jgi:hypothetical protein
VIEIMMFVLNSEVGAEEFFKLDASIQTEFFYAQRGLQRRTTAHSVDGGWVVITFWDSPQDADRAADAFATCGDLNDAWVRAIDQTSITISRYTE